MLKKLLSFTIAVVMIFSCVSVVASAKTITDKEPNNDPDTAQVISSNCTVTGKIPAVDLMADEPELDIDVFKFTVTEYSEVLLTLKSRSQFVIPFITNKNGSMLLMPDMDEDMEELPEEWVISEYLEPGNYYVVLTDFSAIATTKYTFTLSCKPPVPTLKKVKGEWKYYVGEKHLKATTLVKYNGTWFYVKNGVWNKSVTTLVKYQNQWFYVKDGKWTTKPNTLVKYKNQWFYVKNGKWASNAKTLVKYKSKWFFVKNGKWAKDTAIVEYSGKKFYVKNGIAQLNFTGKAKVNDKTYNIKFGKVV